MKKLKKKKRIKKVKRKSFKPKWNMVLGDTLEGMRDLQDKCFHTVVTSPPYWGVRDYGEDEQHGLETTIEEWLEVQVAVFKEVHRILRDDGTLWVNIGDSYVGGEQVGQPWELALALKKSGWILRADCIWHKPNPMPEPGNRKRPTLAHEYVFLFVKSSSYYYDEEAVKTPSAVSGKIPRDKAMQKAAMRESGVLKALRTVWSIPSGGQGKAGHFAAFPDKLPEICIKAGTSEKGCCAVCGVPLKRKMEKTALGEKLLGKAWHDHSEALVKGQRKAPGKITEPLWRTVGWEPQCSCAVQTAPCRVFDPYAGSGTTGTVALSLGRSFTGIELKEEWYHLARKRLTEGSSTGGRVTAKDLKTRADLGLMSDLEQTLFNG